MTFELRGLRPRVERREPFSTKFGKSIILLTLGGSCLFSWIEKIGFGVIGGSKSDLDLGSKSNGFAVGKLNLEAGAGVGFNSSGKDMRFEKKIGFDKLSRRCCTTFVDSVVEKVLDGGKLNDEVAGNREFDGRLMKGLGVIRVPVLVDG